MRQFIAKRRDVTFKQLVRWIAMPALHVNVECDAALAIREAGLGRRVENR